MKRVFITLLFQVLFLFQFYGQEYKYLEELSDLTVITATNGIEKPVTIKIIYDNYLKNNDLETDWGYSILIDGLDKVILYDTGAKPDIFESNFRKMELDASSVSFLVLSHEHHDHTGGIPGFVRMKKDMVESGLEPLLVSKPAMICENLYSSGEFSKPIPEQALVLNTKQGLVIMTGCSHPGIIEMLKEIKSAFKKDIYMVFGGFHLLNKSDKEMEHIIAEMKALGVIKCGATHCTGGKQIKMIREAFGDNFFELGVGNTFEII
jgi:7,8-dihydropterin-6-yl-methyl-4-(beta-D-ribofuranosyl)aminobenzene 5'-phosphate synthase